MQLSDFFGVSRITIRQAITEMVQEGKFYRLKHKGTFVEAPKITQDFVSKLLPFDDEILHNNQIPSTEVLAQDVIPAMPWLIQDHSFASDSKLVYLYRLRFANGKPIVRVKTYLPYDSCGFVLKHDLKKESLYKILKTDPDKEIVRVIRTCRAIEATKEDEQLLEMNRQEPILYFKTLGYNRGGELIEISEAFYNGNKNQFHIEINL